LRLLLYADCAWREMNDAHGTHTGPGWPRYAAEAAIEQGFGLEVSVVTVAALQALPTDPETLPRWVRLSGPPDAIVVQTGSLHTYYRLLPSTEVLDRLRMDVARRLGPALLPANRCADPLVKRLGRAPVPYPGTAELSAFLASVPGAFGDHVPLAVIPPQEPLVRYGDLRRVDERMQREVRAAARAAGAEVIDVAPILRPLGAAARGANRMALNARGSRILGDAVARWMFAGVPVPS
jgi:hypothetical protein